MTYIWWSRDFALYLEDFLSMNIILQDYETVWPDIWPQNECRSLWPIFHGPVILSYILKSICCMNIILWDYESVWYDIWPKNKCRSLRPIFHGAMILLYILKIIWYMNTILRDSVWFVLILFYSPLTHFWSFRARSVNLATLFLGKPPRQFIST